MTELLKELLALAEAKNVAYQVKFGNYKWEDLELPISSLDKLHKELTTNVSGKDADDLEWGDLAALHTKILDFHGVYSDAKLNKSRGIFDAVDEDYEVESYKDDVLKINYKFTIRYENENKDPRDVKGTITLMPGN